MWPRRVRAAGFLPGEAFQFDWSEDWAIIGGEGTKLQGAHFKLCYSRAFILRAYPQQIQPCRLRTWRGIVFAATSARIRDCINQ